MRIFWGNDYNDKAVRVGENVGKVEKQPPRSGGARAPGWLSGLKPLPLAQVMIPGAWD